MKLPRQSEKDIQQSICEMLALNGAEVLEYARPGARPRCPKCGMVVGHVLTQEKAHPDVLTIWPYHTVETHNQRHIWFEVKRPGEKARDDQLAMHARLRTAGDPVYVVESVEDTLAALRMEGIKLRTT